MMHTYTSQNNNRELLVKILNVFLGMVIISLIIWLILLVTGVTGPKKESNTAVKRSKLPPPKAKSSSAMEKALGIKKGTLAPPTKEHFRGKPGVVLAEMAARQDVPGEDKFIYTEKLKGDQNQKYYEVQGKTCSAKDRLMSMKGMVLDVCQSYCKHDSNCGAFMYNFKNGDCITYKSCTYMEDAPDEAKVFVG